MQRLVALFIVMAPIALCSTTLAAQADPSRERAGQLVEEGLSLARKKNFREAADKFAEANRLYPHPEIQHNLARAYEELGDLKQAHYWFAQALKEDYTYASDGQSKIKEIERQLLETYARLTVRTTPGDVRVLLHLADGQQESYVTTPFEAWVPAGRLKIVGTNPDFKTGTRELELTAGESRSVNLVLQPLPKQGFLSVQANVPGATVFLSEVLVGTIPMESITHPVGVYDLKVMADGYITHKEQVVVEVDELTTATVALEPIDGSPPPPVEEPGDGPPTWLGATFVGLGASAVVAAIVLHVKAFKKNDDANAIPISDPPDPVAEARYDKLFGEAKDLESYALYTYVGATALIGTGVLLLILSDDAPDADAATGVTLAPELGLTPDFVGAGATLRF